jgi:hypothetical protein
MSLTKQLKLSFYIFVIVFVSLVFEDGFSANHKPRNSKDQKNQQTLQKRKNARKSQQPCLWCIHCDARITIFQDFELGFGG